MKSYQFTIKKKSLLCEAPVLTNSKAATEFIRQNCIKDEDGWREQCWAIFLDYGKRVIGTFKVSEGMENTCFVSPKAITKVAIENLASGVILTHNHPSGNVRPSARDIEETKKLKSALALFDIALLDHIIISEDNFYSFADE
jgi:DNA repair protein RadC